MYRFLPASVEGHAIQFRGDQAQMCLTYRQQIIARKCPATMGILERKQLMDFKSHQKKDL